MAMFEPEGPTPPVTGFLLRKLCVEGAAAQFQNQKSTRELPQRDPENPSNLSADLTLAGGGGGGRPGPALSLSLHTQYLLCKGKSPPPGAWTGRRGLTST